MLPLIQEIPKLVVPPAAAAIAGPRVGRDERLQAASGRARLAALDYLVGLLLLCRDADPEIRSAAAATLRRIPAEKLTPLLQRPGFPPRLVDFLARARSNDPVLLRSLLASPALAAPTLLFLAGSPESSVLSLLAESGRVVGAGPEVVAALQSNPAMTPDLLRRLGLTAAARPAEVEEEVEEGAEGEEAVEEIDEEHRSKYQMIMEIGVADKIKLALTGDKEWRSLLVKDANKLVNSAVVRNPRITEAEIVTLARNRAATDEQIRLITLNREWMKNYEIKRALVLHPRTPLPNALRYMQVLSEKDLKALAKSRGVSAVIVNQARRMLTQKKKS